MITVSGCDVTGYLLAMLAGALVAWIAEHLPISSTHDHTRR